MKNYKKMFANLTKIVVATAICFTVSLMSCQEDPIEPKASEIRVEGSQNITPIHVFDWEDPNMNTMPYPSSNPPIDPPWIGNGTLSGRIADDILEDRKKADGWELVYSTFHPTIARDDPYFMLYNKYRGLLRIYSYINSLNSWTPSDYLQDGVTVTNKSGGTTLLNFDQTEIVDVTIKKDKVDRSQSDPLSGVPTANNRWYFYQYELAYDPTIAPVTSSAISAPEFSFYVNSINVDRISLGGNIETEINGTIGASQTSAGQNIWEKGVKGSLKNLGTAGLSLIGVEVLDNYSIPGPSNYNNKCGVPNLIWEKMKGGIEGALSTATGNIPGGIINILSAVIGGKSSAGQTVSLTMSGTLTLDGSIVSEGALPSTPLGVWIPGTVPEGSTNLHGYRPNYNKKLGVFNLTQKPTIKIHRIRYPKDPYTNKYTYETTYSLKSGTFNMIKNPEVTAIANFDNLTTDVVGTFYSQVKTNLIYAQATEESIHGELAYSGKNSFRTVHMAYEAPYYTYKNMYLRVAFEIDPKNGAKESVIVKTFAVNIEKTFEYRY